MSRQLHRFLAWVLIASVLTTGCNSVQPFYLHEDGDLSHYLDVATDIEYTDVDQARLAEVEMAREPRTVTNPEYDEIWDLTLEEAISTALHNSKVVRSFGQVRQFGQILQSPPERLTSGAAGVTTIYDPAIQETGQNGPEQALAAFDAVFNFTANWDRQDRPQNALANSGLAQFLQRDQVTVNTELTKRAAVGTQWSIRNVTIYDKGNQFISRAVPSDYFTAIEAELRHPLMRGRGTQVNRVPVILARIQTDITLANFEFSVRNLVSEVERSYWELYFFYRNLAAAKTGRDAALITWKKVDALHLKGAAGGETQNHARASEQYFFFRGRVEEAARDLFKVETRLRYLMGISPTDGRMIRPADEPTTAPVRFDWFEALEEGLARSVELRQQKWTVRQREMALIAARNQLLPQVDILGTYRWLGNGDQFDSSNRRGLNFPAVNSTAIDELSEGRFQEHSLGIQSQIPLGFRREHANVRNAELQIARANAQLEDMELELTNQLTDAFQDLDAQYKLAETNMNRLVHAQREVEALKVALEAGTTTLDLLLDAQRRQAEAETVYYQSLVEYNVAVMMVHFRKGSLLDYDGVVLAEGPWPAKAYHDAHQRARRRDASIYLDYGYSRPNVISQGAIVQNPGNAPATTGSMPAASGPIMFDLPDSSSEVFNAPSNGNIEPIPSDSLPTGPFDDGMDAQPLDNGNQLPEATISPQPPVVENVRQSSLQFSDDPQYDAAGPQASVREMRNRGHVPQRHIHTVNPMRQSNMSGMNAMPIMRNSNVTAETRRSSLRGTGGDGGIQLQWKD